LPRHEVSNYGDPCRHNANIWAGEEYIGVGESASGRRRLSNGWVETKVINGEIVINELSARERAIEVVMTGLRTAKGVSIASLPVDVINWNFIKTNPTYFTESETNLKMSDAGIVILDTLLPRVIV